jgi:hypothetical protein
MTEDDVRQLLLRAAKPFAVNQNTTGVTDWARHYGISAGHMSQLMNGTHSAETKIWDALGLEWRIVRKTRTRRVRWHDHPNRNRTATRIYLGLPLQWPGLCHPGDRQR